MKMMAVPGTIHSFIVAQSLRRLRYDAFGGQCVAARRAPHKHYGEHPRLIDEHQLAYLDVIVTGVNYSVRSTPTTLAGFSSRRRRGCGTCGS